MNAKCDNQGEDGTNAALSVALDEALSDIEEQRYDVLCVATTTKRISTFQTRSSAPAITDSK